MAESGETEVEGNTSKRLEEVKERLSELELSDTVGCFGRPGSQLEDKIEFKSKDGKSVWAYPVLVDFRRLLELGQFTGSNGVIPGISNQDLLHAVVGLYDVCLSDMTADCIYDTICEKWARTIVLVRDLQDTVKDVVDRRKKKREEAKKKKDEDKSGEDSEEQTDDETDEDDEKADPEEDVLEELDEVPSKFEDVYSDTDDEEEEEEDDSDEEEEEPNFTRGIYAFIKKAKMRRKERENYKDEEINTGHVGIENMLMGCASFEKKFVCQQKERVIHLTFIGVRRRARQLQMGRYLLNKCLDPTVVGHYEAVVVHADNGAVDFFRKFGFTDDVILNSKWSELAEQFTQCTMMCYLPGFSLTGTALIEVNKVLKNDPEVDDIEADFKKWQQKSLEAYQSQIMCMKKLQHEILQLKCTLKKQNTLVDKLLDENEKMRKVKLGAERELLTLRLETARSAYKAVSNGDIVEQFTAEDAAEDDINTDQLIHCLERQASADSPNRKLSTDSRRTSNVHGTQSPLLSTPCEDGYYVITGGHVRSQTVPYDHTEDVSIFSDIALQFKQSMSHDSSVKMQYEVSSITKAVLPSHVQEKFHSQIRSLVEPAMVTQLYFCGMLEKPHRCQEVLSGGFTMDDFSHGDYGYGLYFSKYPSKAAQFSALGKLVLAEVGLGEVETVTKEDRTRKAPATGFDSVIAPGRLYRGGGDTSDIQLCQEYVIFNPAQVLPICLLTYQAVSR